MKGKYPVFLNYSCIAQEIEDDTRPWKSINGIEMAKKWICRVNSCISWTSGCMCCQLQSGLLKVVVCIKLKARIE